GRNEIRQRRVWDQNAHRTKDAGGPLSFPKEDGKTSHNERNQAQSSAAHVKQDSLAPHRTGARDRASEKHDRQNGQDRRKSRDPADVLNRIGQRDFWENHAPAHYRLRGPPNDRGSAEKTRANSGRPSTTVPAAFSGASAC